jgi:hypothetical protein
MVRAAHLASEVVSSSMDRTLGVAGFDILMVCMKERGYLRDRQIGRIMHWQGTFPAHKLEDDFSNTPACLALQLPPDVKLDPLLLGLLMRWPVSRQPETSVEHWALGVFPARDG